MKNLKKGVVLIYVLFLVTLSVIFATILLNNNAYLFNVTQYFDIDAKLYSNINSDGKILVDINRQYNLNGSGFVDNISCPTIGMISMSGTTLKSDIGSILVNSGSIYCEATYQTIGDLKIYFNTGFTDFIEADYNGFTVPVIAGLGNFTFSDIDNTLIDFSSYIISTSDFYDDDFNSDNYMVTSTGNTSTGTFYLDGFQDDDVFGRKEIFGYVSPDFGFKKVFWNTDKVLNIINNNINNNDSLNIKMGNVGTGVLYFDIDSESEIKVVEFDKNLYNESKEFKLLTSNSNIISASIGYLQDNSGVLSLTDSITGNEYSFDFINKNYAIFIKATGEGTLLYKIKGETNTGTGIYLTPIDDSDDNIIRYLGNEIIINENGRFIAKELELIYKKW